MLVHEQQARYESLAEQLSNIGKKRSNKKSTEEFWALKDINFEVNQGDRVGIIGRNGAGKSTLLKVLSRITEPTTGQIGVKGKIASLLEVGTGFHPELTGRENIYLNGAILGMSRQDINNKFDDIVAFAEVDKFLDTPVKRYSSGMYVRLAFSVAAHLEPEILIVDEVLAVGDAQFQQKCLSKMQEVSSQGRTILFVSHNMAAIQRLCNRALYLETGTVKYSGDIEEAISQYITGHNKLDQNVNLATLKRRSTLKESVKIDSYSLLNSEGEVASSFKLGETISFEVSCISNQVNAKGLHFVIGIDSAEGQRIATAVSPDKLKFDVKRDENVSCKVSINLNLTPGNYLVTLAIREDQKTLIDQLEHIGSFSVSDARVPELINEIALPFGYISLQNLPWEIQS